MWPKACPQRGPFSLSLFPRRLLGVMLGRKEDKDKRPTDGVLGSQEPGQRSQAAAKSWMQRLLPHEAEGAAGASKSLCPC